VAGLADPGKRRKATRTGRQTGAGIFLSGEELAEAGVPLGVDLWWTAAPGRREKRGRFVITFHTKP
jgi:hypothetical protein